MNEKIDTDNAKSAIVFYAIEHKNIEDLSYEDAWKICVAGNFDEISCRNIFRFDMTADNLGNILRNPIQLDKAILKGIEEEHLMGDANFMFVKPEVGEPIDGFFIKAYIAQAKS